ncbi:MAG TPA: alpha/beta hydrolase [Tepidisphaeraceae bacterium]|jgi:pimeloyl-ACP methyl ester carboxylesterase|nr:alpha/beta hydrolase [Tepidisphaeraceae bacterium]
MGGAYIRVFAADHPGEVSGMVLVDPIHAEAIEPFDDAKAWFDAHCPQEWQRAEKHISLSSEGLAPLLASSFKALEQCCETSPDEKRAALRREYWALCDNAPRETFAPIASPGAKLVVAKRGGHNIQSEDPQIVINSIGEVIRQSR